MIFMIVHFQWEKIRKYRKKKFIKIAHTFTPLRDRTCLSIVVFSPSLLLGRMYCYINLLINTQIISRGA